MTEIDRQKRVAEALRRISPAAAEAYDSRIEARARLNSEHRQIQEGKQPWQESPTGTTATSS